MKQVIIYIIYFLLCLQVSAQQSIEALIDRFETFHRNYPAEKIYIHTDKPYYAAGEQMYLSLYHLDAYTNQPLPETSFITVYLMHPDGRAVSSRKFKLENGFGASSLLLADTLSTGVYELHAYTAWMTNFSSKPVFRTQLWLEGLSKINDEACKPFDVVILNQPRSIVDGLPSHLSFQLLDNCRRLITEQVNFINSNNDLTATVKPDELGIYVISDFIFLDDTYTILLPERENKTISLKHYITNHGAMLKIAAYDNNRLKIDLNVSENLIGKDFYILSQTRGEVSLKVELNAEKKLTSFLIPKNQFKTGINTISLFDGDLTLLHEVVYYQPQSRDAKLIWENARENYNTRSLNQFNFKINASTAPQQQSRISASVYRKYKDEMLPNNMANDLNLISELATPHRNNLIQQADKPLFGYNVQSTISSFSNIVLNPDALEIKSIEHPKFDIIKGNVTHKLSGNALADSVLILSVRALNGSVYTAKTDVDGNFQFLIPKVIGDAELYFALKYGSISEYVIKLEENAVEKNYSPSGKLIYTETPSAYYLKNLQRNYIATLFELNDCIPYKDIQLDLSFISFDASFNLDEYNLPPTVEEVIVDILSGIRVRNQKGRKVINVLTRGEMISKKYTAGLRGKSLLLMDGVYLNEEEFFLKMNPENIQNISLVYSEYFLGETSFAGVISIETKQADQLSNLPVNITGIRFPYKGLIEFSATDLPCAGSRDKTNPDIRYLLAWEPDLMSEKDGSFSFFVQTSDEEGDYIITIQGITTDGIPFSQTFEFNVSFSR
jgi:hypothetical protein